MEIENESDLFAPVKTCFEDLGFSVYGEIKDCDIAAVKDDMLVVIELKKQFSLKLIYQAMERKIFTENVFVAIPRPKNFKDKDTKGMRRLLKELNIGLITIFDMGGTLSAQIISQPEPLGVQSKSKKRNKILKEIQGRKLNLNKGGITKTKILTAYKEKSIFLVCLMEKFHILSLSHLRSIPEISDFAPILYRNYNKWFDKAEKGVYTLSKKGIEILDCEDFSEAVRFYKNKAEEIYLREDRENV